MVEVGAQICRIYYFYLHVGFSQRKCVFQCSNCVIIHVILYIQQYDFLPLDVFCVENCSLHI